MSVLQWRCCHCHVMPPLEINCCQWCPPLLKWLLPTRESSITPPLDAWSWTCNSFCHRPCAGGCQDTLAMSQQSNQLLLELHPVLQLCASGGCQIIQYAIQNS